MKKIKAYSLIELMVVMVIGSITIAVAYQGYALFYQQFLTFKKTVYKNASIAQVEALLFSDFHASKEVLRTGEGVLCRHKKKDIIYIWTEGYILRKQEAVTDSFFLKNQHVKFMLHEKEAAVNELVSDLSFEGTGDAEGMFFIFHKEYGADVLVNADIKTNL